MTAPVLPKVSGYKTYSLPNLTQEQQGVIQQQLPQMGQGTRSGIDYYNKLASGDQSMFQDIEAPAYEAFNKLLGQVGSRFSQYGGRDSSAFQNAIAGAGGELSQNLASQRNNLRQSAIDKLLGQQNQLLGIKAFETGLQPKNRKQGFDWGGMLQALAPILGGMMGGPPGAMAGSAAAGGMSAYNNMNAPLTSGYGMGG